jgi:hypothetical protein
METKKRANSVISTRLEGDTIVFAVVGVGEMTLGLGELSQAVKHRAMVHGLIQRVSDAAALSRNTETGQSATPSDKFHAMKDIVDHYRTGTTEWTLRRASGGGETRENGITLRALAAVQGADVATMRERVEKLAEKQGITTRAILAKIATQPAVAAKIAELRAQTVSVDVEDMLAELGE